MLTWVCAALPIASLGCLDSVGTLQAFYQAIASHNCQQAVSLSEGYSLERCQAIANLKLADAIKIVKKQDDKATLQFKVTYQAIKQAPITTEATVELKQVESLWKVDFSTIKPLTNQTDITNKPQVVEAKPKPIEQVKQPEPPLQQTVSTPTPTQQPTGLLSLWTDEELQGKAGDEKIRWHKADLNPPAKMTTDESLPPLNPDYVKSIRRVNLPKEKKWIALTFDLCERADEIAGYDRGIINTLRHKKTKATFYAGGKWMQSHPEKTKQIMADNLFEIGNHGWTHGNLRVLTGEKAEQQIVWTQAEYQRQWVQLYDKAQTAGLAELMTQIPKQPATFRFPFGTCSPESLQMTNDIGLSAVQWDVVSGDPAITVQPNQIINMTRTGSILIFHANGRGRGTATALPNIIDGLRAKGFEFVTVSELLAAGKIEAVDECYELVKDDNLEYDALYGEGTVYKKHKPKPKPKPLTITPPPLMAPVEIPAP